MKFNFLLLATLFSISFQSAPESFQRYTQTISGSEQSLEMVPILGGHFSFGSPQSEIGRRSDEGPVREMKVGSFWMSTIEIPWDIYELFLYREIDQTPQSRGHIELEIDGVSGATMPYINLNRPGYPVTNITQYAASQFCKWLTAKTGYFYRLPTEAEWEYACRAGTKGPYSFLEDEMTLDDVAWFRENSKLRVHKGGQKAPNAFGLFDMHGNIAEWVLDGYSPRGYTSIAPVRISKRLYPRVVRGGSFRDGQARLRSAARGYSRKNWKKQDPQSPKSLWWHTDAPHIGFRIVRPKAVPSKHDMEKYWVKPIKEY
ncbi:MAG: sulfatase-modifying factor [Candidatus Marinimicrobia bacterium]|nr:sulfatase-modifying factor [Candidatus Neomarinimicrobiota bacterium]